MYRKWWPVPRSKKKRVRNLATKRIKMRWMKYHLRALAMKYLLLLLAIFCSPKKWSRIIWIAAQRLPLHLPHLPLNYNTTQQLLRVLLVVQAQRIIIFKLSIISIILDNATTSTRHCQREQLAARHRRQTLSTIQIKRGMDMEKWMKDRTSLENRTANQSLGPFQPTFLSTKSSIRQSTFTKIVVLLLVIFI